MPVSVVHRRPPRGAPEVDDFEVVEEPMPTPGRGSAVIASTYLSVDPGLRSRIRDIAAADLVGSRVWSSTLGRVHEPGDTGLRAGQVVRGRWGWAEYVEVDADELEVVDTEDDVDLVDEIGVLGMPGMVAYVGLLDVGRPRAGETLYVNAAAGAIGSMVGQVAHALGLTVIGSAGTDEKVALLHELGFDHAFNYRSRETGDALREYAPAGLDLCFDNVGGDQLQAALDAMALHGRIVCCGSVATYNDDPRGPALHGLRQVVTKRLRMEGFVIWDHDHRAADHRRDTLSWLRSGALRPLRTVTDGIASAPQTFVSMLQGANTGKTSVRV